MATVNMSKAAELAGVSRQTIYNHVKKVSYQRTQMVQLIPLNSLESFRIYALTVKINRQRMYQIDISLQIVPVTVM